MYHINILTPNYKISRCFYKPVRFSYHLSFMIIINNKAKQLKNNFKKGNKNPGYKRGIGRVYAENFKLKL